MKYIVRLIPRRGKYMWSMMIGPLDIFFLHPGRMVTWRSALYWNTTGFGRLRFGIDDTWRS